MPQGTVRDYNRSTGDGSLLMDDETEVRILPASTEGSEIRDLRLGQRVDFRLAEEEDGTKVAHDLHIVTFS